MARLASQAKAGFYPLPELLIPLIQSYLDAPQGGRILDPCAGTGEPLVAFAQHLALEPYGIELHEDRAAQSQSLVEALVAQARSLPLHDTPQRRVLRSDYRMARLPFAAFNLLYLNPPYDADAEMGRIEYHWLRDTRPYLQAGGVLVLVIPQHVLADRTMAKYLASWFHDVQVGRFPDGEYETFKQIVLLARRNPAAIPAPPASVQQYYDWAAQEANLAVLATPPHAPFTLPKPVVSPAQFFFRGYIVDPQDAIADVQRYGITHSADYRQHFTVSETGHTAVAPLMPLKRGHLAGVIAAGFLDNQRLHDPATGDTVLLRGRTFKALQTSSTVATQPDGSKNQVTTQTEQIKTTITALHPDGTVQELMGAALETFLERWMPQLTAAITHHFPPLYTFDYQPFATVLNALSKGRRIPFSDQTGLLPAQKHAVAGLVKRLQAHKDALLVGTMGTGKSSIAVAVAAVLSADRTLVLCPPHLTHKWKREAETVWPASTVTILNTLSEVDAFFRQGVAQKRIGIISTSKGKLASGWHHAAWQGLLSEEHLMRLRPHPAWMSDTEYNALLASCQEKYTQWRGLRCPRCGAMVQDRQGNPEHPATFYHRSSVQQCGQCNEPLYSFKRGGTVNSLAGFSEYCRREAQVRFALQHGGPRPSFASPKGYARWPLATYIRERYSGQVDLLIADEAHELKAGDTDQGMAFGSLAVAARKVLAMTGTIFGGRASSLFYILYRLSPEFRHNFTRREESGSVPDVKKWGRLYGIEQTIETRKVEDTNGKLTGNRRDTLRVRELPGASPAMLPWLLNRSVFLSLQDMGFVLPTYEEIPLAVQMSPEMQARYDHLHRALKAELDKRLVRRDKSLLGAYLQSLLAWPDAPFREEIVLDPHTRDEPHPTEIVRVAALPAGVVYPKERAILDLMLAEKAAGRRCVLYVIHTGTRDITGRWMQLLAAHHLKGAVLKVDPDKREGWIRAREEDGTDVIITHPRRVATGLDLIGWPTLIWGNVDYSVYTVLQASKRAWRIGQEQACKTYFFTYAGVLQEEALRLVATKIAAALRVNGDFVDVGSLAELDELAQSDMLGALAKLVQAQEEATPSLSDAFAEANAERQAGDRYLAEAALAHAEAPSAPVVEAAPTPGLSVMTSPLMTLTVTVSHPRRRGPSLLEALQREQAQPAA